MSKLKQWRKKGPVKKRYNTRLSYIIALRKSNSNNDIIEARKTLHL